MTPFSQTVIPPPYSAYQLQQSVHVNQVIFASQYNAKSVVVLLQNDQVVIYDYLHNQSDKVDESVKVGVAGGNGFKVCCKTPVTRGIYR